MSSSVSSERAFSQGGITVSKRRNRLKGDIVEALQCVKCSLRHDLLFREPAPSSRVESDSEELDSELDADGGEKMGDVTDDEDGWDAFIATTSEDDDLSDFEIDY